MAGMLWVRTISRGQGQSAVRAAAYCGRRRLYDERLGRTFHYGRRPGLAYSEWLLPADGFWQKIDSGAFWNAIERNARRVNARLAREIILALPRAFALDRQIALARGFLEDAFVGAGHAVEWHLHRDRPRNPHAHALVSFARLTEEGFAPPEAAFDRRAFLVGLHSLWRRHWERAGAGMPGAGGHAAIHLGASHALMQRGVITRQGQRLAAWHALAAQPAARRRPGWLRVRLRRLARARRRRLGRGRGD